MKETSWGSATLQLALFGDLLLSHSSLLDSGWNNSELEILYLCLFKKHDTKNIYFELFHLTPFPYGVSPINYKNLSKTQWSSLVVHPWVVQSKCAKCCHGCHPLYCIPAAGNIVHNIPSYSSKIEDRPYCHCCHLTHHCPKCPRGRYTSIFFNPSKCSWMLHTTDIFIVALLFPTFPWNRITKDWHHDMVPHLL